MPLPEDPATPVKASASNSESTPPSRGSASRPDDANKEEAEAKVVELYLSQDIENRKTLVLDLFLDKLLASDADRCPEGCQTHALTLNAQFDEYRNARLESGRYAPMINIKNSILQFLFDRLVANPAIERPEHLRGVTQPPFLFRCSAARTIRGSSARRSPDIFLVNTGAYVTSPAPNNVKDATLNPAEEKGFFWSDGISAHELKLKSKKSGKTFTEEPTEDDLEEEEDLTYVEGLSTSLDNFESSSDGIPTSGGKRKAGGCVEMERTVKKQRGEYQCNVKSFAIQCAASALELMSGCGFQTFPTTPEDQAQAMGRV